MVLGGWKGLRRQSSLICNRISKVFSSQRNGSQLSRFPPTRKETNRGRRHFSMSHSIVAISHTASPPANQAGAHLETRCFQGPGRSQRTRFSGGNLGCNRKQSPSMVRDGRSIGSAIHCRRCMTGRINPALTCKMYRYLKAILSLFDLTRTSRRNSSFNAKSPGSRNLLPGDH